MSSDLFSELEYHPAAGLFPMMDQQQLMELADHIRAHGLLEPIAIYDGKVLDGRNRLEACRLAGVEPRFKELNGEGKSPTIYAFSSNFHRRHLTSSQRAAIAAEMLPLLQNEAKKRQGKRNDLVDSQVEATLVSDDTEVGRSRDIAARTLKISGSIVARAAAVKKADPELFEKIKSGEITVAAAQEIVKERETVPENKVSVKRFSESRKNRIVQSLAGACSTCDAIANLDIARMAASFTKDELEGWINRAKIARRSLAELITKVIDLVLWRSPARKPRMHAGPRSWIR